MELNNVLFKEVRNSGRDYVDDIAKRKEEEEVEAWHETNQDREQTESRKQMSPKFWENQTVLFFYQNVSGTSELLFKF